jgi:hypothetical protein
VAKAQNPKRSNLPGNISAKYFQGRPQGLLFFVQIGFKFECDFASVQNPGMETDENKTNEADTFNMNSRDSVVKTPSLPLLPSVKKFFNCDEKVFGASPRLPHRNASVIPGGND